MEFENIYIVYVKPDFNGYITAVNSSDFLKDLAGWKEIDRGCGVRFYHAQTAYFEEHIFTDGGAYRYKLVDGKVVECTPEEIAQQEEAFKPAEIHSAQDDTDAMLIDHEYRLTLLELGITE